MAGKNSLTMSDREPAAVRHTAECGCHACGAGELTAATPNSDLALEQPGRLDPTNTITIQRELARFLRGRLASLNSEVRERIVKEDVFGLLDGAGEWASGPRQARIGAFADWLRVQADREVLDEIDTERVRQYLERAAERGVRDGHEDLQEFDVQTGDVETVIQQDAVQEAIDERHAALQDRVGRAVGDYRADARSLVAAGLAANVARRELASDITERATVYQSHVTTQASGEVVNQYNTTQLTSYDRVDEEVELDVEAEYVDAGDDKVCEECLALSAQTWTLERAQQENPIPVHGYCRCRFRVTDVRRMF